MRIAAWRLQESNLTYSQRVAKRPSHSLINVVSQSFLARPRLFPPSLPVELHRIGIYRPTEKKNPAPCPSPMEFFLLSLLHFNYTGAKMTLEVSRHRGCRADWIKSQRMDAGRGRVASWLAWRKKREEPAGKFAILIRERWRFSPASGWLYAPQLSRWWLASNERRRKKRRKWLASSLISNGNPLSTPG